MAELVESLQRRREALPESAREVWDTLRKRGHHAFRTRNDRHLEPKARPTFGGTEWANRVAVSILEEAEGDLIDAAFEIAQRIEREADMSLREARLSTNLHVFIQGEWV